MRHADLPHILLIEPSPVAALLSAAELDAAGVEWTLAASAADGLAWAAALCSPYGTTPVAILVSFEPGTALDGAALVRELHRRMRQGTLRETPVFAMAHRMDRAVEAAAIDAGCQLLRAPLRAGAAHFLAALLQPDRIPAGSSERPMPPFYSAA